MRRQSSHLSSVIVVLLAFMLAGFSTSRASLPGNPPNLGCSVQELYGRWLRASGGEQAWKGLRDISLDLVSKQMVGDIEDSKAIRKVRIKIQPRFRARLEFPDEKGLRTIWGLDGKGYFLYREALSRVGEPSWWDRQPEVICDPKTRDNVEYEIKATAFWLGLPFDVQLPGTRLTFAGWLDPGKLGARPLPMLKVDLTEVAAQYDWPIDQVTVALNPDTWLPTESNFRFVGDPEADWTCLFRHYTTTCGITYPRVRVFFKESEPGERVEIMERVRLNRRMADSYFERPAWRERAHQREF